jgi:uncharacterized protein
MTKRILGIAAVLAAAVLATLAVPSARAQEEDSNMDGIIVQGTGEVQVRPDIARLNLGVQTQGPDSSRAAQENAKLTQAVIDAIKGAGVDEKDIQTANYSIFPQYDQRPQPLPANEGKPPAIVGYQVNNTVNVTVRNMGSVGTVIDAAVKAGANVAAGISFDVDEPAATKAREEAMRKAVANALSKARLVAEAAGVSRITLAGIIEGSVNIPRPMFDRMAMRAAGAESVPTPVQPGQQTITATVTARYTIAEPPSTTTSPAK